MDNKINSLLGLSLPVRDITGDTSRTGLMSPHISVPSPADYENHAVWVLL